MTCWAKFPQYLDPGYNRLIFKWCGDMTPKKLNDCLNQPAVLTPVGCKHCGFHEEESCLQYLFWYFMDRWQHNSLMCVGKEYCLLKFIKPSWTRHRCGVDLCLVTLCLQVCAAVLGAASGYEREVTSNGCASFHGRVSESAQQTWSPPN